MTSMFDKAQDLADQHDDKVDNAIERVGDQVEQRTGDHGGMVDKGVDFIQGRTGDGDTNG